MAAFIKANPTFDTFVGFDVYPLRVLWVRARLLSKIDSGLSSFAAVDKWDEFQDILSDADDHAPDSAKHASIVSDLWVRVFTEVVAVNGIKYGVIVATVVAMLCLVLFTGNIFVAMLAVASIGANVLTMLALYSLWGWTLGAVEAISVSILVGLSGTFLINVFDCAHRNAFSRLLFSFGRGVRDLVGENACGASDGRHDTYGRQRAQWRVHHGDVGVFSVVLSNSGSFTVFFFSLFDTWVDV